MIKPSDLYVTPAPRWRWDAYAPAHYLGTSIHRCSRVWIAHHGLDEAGCIVAMHAWGRPGYWRISRIGVREECQGQGIGGALLDWTAAELVQSLHATRVSVITALWPIIHHCDRSLLWRLDRTLHHGNQPHNADRYRHPQHVTSWGRAVRSYIYVM